MHKIFHKWFPAHKAPEPLRGSGDCVSHEFDAPTPETTDIEPLLKRLTELHHRYCEKNGTVFGWAYSEIWAWRECANNWKAQCAGAPVVTDAMTIRMDAYLMREGFYLAPSTVRAALEAALQQS